MVSDTWSTDVLASDTEGPAGLPDPGGAAGDALLLHLRAQRSRDLGELAGINPASSAAGHAMSHHQVWATKPFFLFVFIY